MIKPINKIVNIAYFLFPFLWGMALFVSIVETFFYTDFVAKQAFLSSDLFIILTIWSGLIIKFTTSSKLQNLFFRLIRFFNKPLFHLFSFLLVFFLLLEASHYPNYVFSVYHLHPKNLFWPWFLCLFLLFTSPSIPQEFLFKKSLILTMVIWILASNVFTIHGEMVDNLYFIFGHPFISFDDKMRHKTGQGFYDYVLFVKRNTPENATILIPPQGYPWPQTGNNGYFRYFLHPRRLLSGKEFEPGVDLNKEKIDYVLLAAGESPETQYGFTHGWPKFNVQAKRVIYWTNESQKVILGNFIYNKDEASESQWGLIELERRE